MALPEIDLSPILLAKIYGMGLFFDCVTFTYAAAPLGLAVALLPERYVTGRFFRPGVLAVFFVATYALGTA